MTALYHAQSSLFPVKVCKKCHTEKLLDEFPEREDSRDGHRPVCQVCINAQKNEYRYKIGVRHKPIPLPEPVNGGRVCINCLAEKPLGDFVKNKSAKNGGNICKICFNEQMRTNYAASDKEQKHAQTQAWYEANKERHHELVQTWMESHPLKRREIKQRRRTREKDTATSDPVDYEHILERDGPWCYICEKSILPYHKIEFDHVTPLSRNGPHSEENIRVTHLQCNRRKHDRLLSELTPYQRRGII